MRKAGEGVYKDVLQSKGVALETYVLKTEGKWMLASEEVR